MYCSINHPPALSSTNTNTTGMNLKRRSTSGGGIRRFRPQGVTKTTPSGDRTTWSASLPPNSTHFTRGLVKYVPGRGFFRATPYQNRDKFVTSPPPHLLNDCNTQGAKKQSGIRLGNTTEKYVHQNAQGLGGKEEPFFSLDNINTLLLYFSTTHKLPGIPYPENGKKTG